MTRMRILYWTELFWPHIGGVEIFSMHLMTALQNRGCEFSVVTSTSDKAQDDNDVWHGIPIHRFHFQRTIAQRDIRKIQQLKTMVTNLIARIEPDLVHINSTQPSIFFYSLVSKSLAIPTLFTVHGLNPNLHSANSLVSRQLHNADWVSAVSQAALSQARLLVPEIKPRSSVIYNGLPIPDDPLKDLPHNPPILLCIGRIVKPKGFDLAIKALRQIREVIPSVRLVIAGDGPAKPDLESLVQTLGLGSAVEFRGWCQPNLIPALIDTSTIVLVPSRLEESFGLAALEAAQRARPVIAADLSGLPEVVIHEETGLLFEEDNPTDLAQKVIFLLTHPQTAVRMGETARVRAEREFNIETAAEAYQNIYQKLICSDSGETI